MRLLRLSGVPRGFNIAWIAGGHPFLDANALGQEASKNLGLLLNQLRAPEASSIPSPVAIVLVNRSAHYSLPRKQCKFDA